MQPDQEIAGTNLSVNRLAIRRAFNATGNEAEGVDHEIMRRRDVLVTRIGMILSNFAILTSVSSERRQA